MLVIALFVIEIAGGTAILVGNVQVSTISLQAVFSFLVVISAQS